jgi:Zn-dependent protease with chaperone function
MNELDLYLDYIQEQENLNEFTTDELLGIGTIATGAIILNIAFMLASIGALKASTKYNPKLSDAINTVLGRKDIRVNIVKDKIPNAFAAGGKTIYLSSGLLKDFSDREVIAIMLHEVYHNEKKHIVKKLAYEYPFYYLLTFLIASFISGPLSGLIGLLVFRIGRSIIRIPYQITIARKHEYEADSYAVRFGYGDDQISALKKLEDMYRKQMTNMQCDLFCKIYMKIDEALDEHPSMANRIENILKKKEIWQAAMSGKLAKVKAALGLNLKNTEGISSGA